jgi:hypothetical protein
LKKKATKYKEKCARKETEDVLTLLTRLMKKKTVDTSSIKLWKEILQGKKELLLELQKSETSIDKEIKIFCSNTNPEKVNKDLIAENKREMSTNDILRQIYYRSIDRIMRIRSETMHVKKQLIFIECTSIVFCTLKNFIYVY